MRNYHIMGTYHTDLAWKGDAEQYADYLEQFVVLMLDMLDLFPDMTYMIEQAYHYRELQKKRPDLIERLKQRIEEGRIEVMGGMISTADSNVPCAESIVRNQLMGMRWFKENMNADIHTGWLFDSFGSHAQMPQLMASFGLRRMMASRFGGEQHSDIFYAKGIDGTKLLVAGRDCFSPNLPSPERSRIFLECTWDGALVDALYASAKKAQSDGPLMLNVYVEDELYPTRRMIRNAYAFKEEAEALGDHAAFSLPHKFFDDLQQYTDRFPTVSADLNPEFTGTFSQRMEIRLHNRRTETILTDAEKWLALSGQRPSQALHDAWWDMGFVHFHDVFTGSHPETVFNDVLSRLTRTEALARDALENIFGPSAAAENSTVQVVNGLPFPRREWIRIPAVTDVSYQVSCSGMPVPSHTEHGTLCFEATVDACAGAVYNITRETDRVELPTEKVCTNTVLENGHVRLTVDVADGISLETADGSLLLDRARDLLVLQGDTGSFQIERIEDAEQYAWTFPVEVRRISDVEVKVSGVFGHDTAHPEAAWSIHFILHPDSPLIEVHLHTDWKAVGKRLRLKLNTTLQNAGEGIYEIPFGVIRRRAYVPAFNRKGEWPAQRFAAIEDDAHGLALLNDGVPGVEILGGTLYTTLLRAPTENYAGMVPDLSSQQHGTHDFTFALLPYAAPWQDTDLLPYAQCWNQPLRAFAVEKEKEPFKSQLCIENRSVVLSAVKPTEDPSRNGIILRLYESTGHPQNCDLYVCDMRGAWYSDMKETLLAALPIEDSKLHLQFAPWEIKTLYIERNSSLF